MTTAQRRPPLRTGLLLVDSRFRGNDVWEGRGTPAARTRSPSNGLGIIRKHYTGKGCHPCVWASIGGFEVARLNVLEAFCQNLFPAGSGVSVTISRVISTSGYNLTLTGAVRLTVVWPSGCTLKVPQLIRPPS